MKVGVELASRVHQVAFLNRVIPLPHLFGLVTDNLHRYGRIHPGSPEVGRRTVS